MAEYIERDAAMDIFGDVPMWQGYYEPYPWEVHCAIVGIVKLLKEEISKIPAADVAPVVLCLLYGVWIASTSGYTSGAICAPKMRNCSADAKSGYAQPGKTISATTGKGKNDE